jgi:hypothetical protein
LKNRIVSVKVVDRHGEALLGIPHPLTPSPFHGEGFTLKGFTLKGTKGVR